MIYNAIVTEVERLSTASKSEFVTVNGMDLINIGLIPVGDRDVILYEGGTIGKTYEGYTSSSGFKDTDRLTISGYSNKFIIQGITNQSVVGIINNYKLILFEGK